MYSNKQLIVLMAGHGSRLYPLTFTLPKSLLSIGQKPSIYNMLIPLIKEGLKDIIFVVNEENKNIIKKFMDYSFNNILLNIKYVIQNDLSGPGMALKLTKDYIIKNVILLLGDTLCSYPTCYDKSFISAQKVEKEQASNYCILDVDKNNKIISLNDKPQETLDTNYAAIGFYYFDNFKLLKKILDSKITKINNEFQLSSYFEKYMEKEPMYLQEVNDWKDIGTLDNYMKANKESFNCRNFNSLYLDDISVLHKKSSWEKIKSEMNWYKEIINTDFEKLTPKFYNNNKFSNEYGIEYYDYLTLSEYFTFYPLEDFNKNYIFNKLFSLLSDIYSKNKIVSLSFRDYLREMLIEKTKRRLLKWDRQDLVKMNDIYINGEKYIGIEKCLHLLEKRINKICDSSINHVSILHGDTAFSNILFSPRNMIFKFIDPRGNFIVDTIYGDYRYDLAKLRHCYHGRYDEIINDLFAVENNDCQININFFKKNNEYKEFDKIMSEGGNNIDDIELIEGLLFLSMISLHSDFPNRQLAFFTQGIKILNNQIGVE